MKRNHIVFFNKHLYMQQEEYQNGISGICEAINIYNYTLEEIKEQLKFWINSPRIVGSEFAAESHRALSNFDQLIFNMERRHLIILSDKKIPFNLVAK